MLKKSCSCDGYVTEFASNDGTSFEFDSNLESFFVFNGSSRAWLCDGYVTEGNAL
jgi:hypothetical protein